RAVPRLKVLHQREERLLAMVLSVTRRRQPLPLSRREAIRAEQDERDERPEQPERKQWIRSALHRGWMIRCMTAANRLSGAPPWHKPPPTWFRSARPRRIFACLTW